MPLVGGQYAGDVGHAPADVGVERVDDLLAECGGAECDRPPIALECFPLHQSAPFEIASAFGEHAGLPARYEALPLHVLGDNPDTRATFRWFAETPAYQADIDAVKAIEPSAWDLPTWLPSTGWTLPGR